MILQATQVALGVSGKEIGFNWVEVFPSPKSQNILSAPIEKF